MSKTLTKEKQHITCNFKHLCLVADTLDNTITTFTELEIAINSLKASAPGGHQLQKHTLRSTLQTFLEIMLFNFNAI
jgi:hypothetical protein